MQQADEFRTFSSACEQTNRPLTEKEARVLEVLRANPC
jgi:hypothetical protein